MSISWWVLITLIPITILFICIGIFIYVKIRIKMKRDFKLNKIKEKINIEMISKADKIITRISLISKKTPRYKGLYEKLKRKFGSIDSLSKKINADFNDLIAKKYSMNSKDFKNVINSLGVSIKTMSELEFNFKKLTETVTQQEKLLSSEFLYYSSHLREAIEIYRTKRITIDSISSKVDELASRIKNKGRAFNQYIASAENSLASKILGEYIALVIDFSTVISEAPTINVYINETITKVISNIATLYVKKKEELNAPMGHIDFKEAIKKISEVYQKAKYEYHNLDFTSCKKNIISILKSTKTLERLINYEIKSRNFFVTNYSLIQEEIVKSIKNYEAIKSNIRSIVERGEVVHETIIFPINNAEKIKVDLLNSIKYLREVSKTNSIPFSAKMSKVKLLANKTNEFIETLNIAIKGIWEQNIEVANVKNKYIKSNAAINELLANINSKSLILKPKKAELLKTIEKRINDIALKINSNAIDDELRSTVEVVMDNTTKLYSSAMGDIMIADITSNLINDLAPERALDNSLNFSLNKAERQYIDGKYSESLNIIISELERKK